MIFRRRERVAGDRQRGHLEQISAQRAEEQGDKACTERGCTSELGVACDYVDRRGRRCRSAWCPDHRLVVDGGVYCRRHAGVVSALPGGVHAASPYPDLDNRAPSLVSWVARDVDADIRRLLLDELDQHTGGQLIADPVYLVFLGTERRRAWERTWKLATHRGMSLRVALQVEEDADAEVAVKVGTEVLARIVPPWILRRLHGGGEDPAAEARRRETFRASILRIVAAGIQNERRLSRDTSGRDPMVRGVARHRGG